jgi:hypothetical protein
MQMLKKLFNSENKFHLELDEIKESEAVQTAVKTASKAADTVKEKASDLADSQAVQKAVTIAKDVVSDEKDTPSKSNKSQDKPEAKSGKTQKPEAKSAKAKDKPEAKTQQNGKQADTPTQETAPSLENSGASSFDPPFWVAAMYNTNDSDRNSEGETAQSTFATDNLMPIGSKFRRRPGGSLDKFKKMAKQTKTPKG